MFENCKTPDDLIKILKTVKYTDNVDKTLLRIALTTKLAEIGGNINDLMRCANALEL